MISKQEIMDFAWELSLDPNTVEKDYVLGWLLAGISSHSDLKSKWIFKGGTCLKKCFFETYRFSEDLDFTLVDPKHLTQKFLIKTFVEIAQWIYDRTGIEIPEDKIRFDIHTNQKGRTSAEGRASYIGPMKRRGDPPRVKIDLACDEILILNPVTREIHHPYSDRIQGAIITKLSFKPKYTIELTPSRPISAPPTSIKPRSSRRDKTRRYKPTRRKLEGRGISGQPAYIIQCTACGKKFKRKRFQTQLNPHRNKEGYPCPSRIGYIVDVKH